MSTCAVPEDPPRDPISTHTATPSHGFGRITVCPFLAMLYGVDMQSPVATRIWSLNSDSSSMSASYACAIPALSNAMSSQSSSCTGALHSMAMCTIARFASVVSLYGVRMSMDVSPASSWMPAPFSARDTCMMSSRSQRPLVAAMMVNTLRSIHLPTKPSGSWL